MYNNIQLDGKKPHKIGIALSGGGIKGLCHAGVLKALEEYGIKPDIISGVSAGAVVGALYADGYSPDEIADFFDGIEFKKMTRLHIDGGFFSIDAFEKFLGKRLRAKKIEDLKLPLHIVATDLDHGKSVVFTSDTLVNRIMASCSLPVLFTPKIIDGTKYVDGGVLKNFPVSTIRNECELLIGINCSPMVAADYKVSIVNVAMRAYHFMFKANILHDKELCDILIEPSEMALYETFDVKKSREIFQLGYTTAKKMIESEAGNKFLENYNFVK